MLRLRHIVCNLLIIIAGCGTAGIILANRELIPPIWNPNLLGIFAGIGVCIAALAWLLPLTKITSPSKQLLSLYSINTLLITLLVICSMFMPSLPNLPFLPKPAQKCTLEGGYTLTIPDPIKGIGIQKDSEGKCIGLSDGSFAFDTNRTSGLNKYKAAEKFRKGDIDGAREEWQNASQKETNDAEALIDQENQRVISSSYPYITLVVATTLSGSRSKVSTGLDNLQGAYVAQKEYNDNNKLPGSTKVRLLIANTGNTPDNASIIAQQIVETAKNDPTIVGVMGWSFSSHAFVGYKGLDAARIPMVSPTASSDELTGVSPYFFRVNPGNKAQATMAAKYANNTLGVHNIALFVDRNDPYSEDLADNFSKAFSEIGGSIADTETYTVTKLTSQNSINYLNNVAKKPVDMIYFAGYSDDLGILLKEKATFNQLKNVRFMGADALYELGGYPQAVFNNLYFTAFSYPDLWGIVKPGTQKPDFFDEYRHDFNPNDAPVANPYGFTRADNDTMLSYDATLALLHGCMKALEDKGDSKITPVDVRKGLVNTAPFQGVSGRIAFTSSGNPDSKIVVMLQVNEKGEIQFVSQEGILEV